MPLEPLPLDANGLYILLENIGYENSFHWGFYLATSSSDGYIIHMTYNEATTAWIFEEKLTSDVGNSPSLLVAVKIAVVEQTLQHHLVSRLRSANRHLPALTCRTWLMNALKELDDEGYISLIKSARFIEGECIQAAATNYRSRARLQTASSQFKTFVN
ncbi:hypothetical protein BU24DRAFT_410145 [Aaosphaeria arxii CBS 175.79]|uniref:Uncharacterized protein n=1 Tax=Aaosphaeria arxii CBS 175.79 TaxID=1450172 RepID=A0A6A5XNB7_9PLEO|nr:uncharacterized protein BU24DRAFT_410145 [Aaosphaeria arxii CBS 175.79]KAF2014396.1 hypothetical protein BU24DRAFT_410145 [Aaosphaeria arxii CBS 175.79]